jgi:protocatechuate 3,4-dioxygenase beta subunit
MGLVMRFISYLVAGVAMALANVAQAEPSCAPSTTVAAQHYPGAEAIPTTNNLLQPAGKAVAATGQKIVIRGRVVDTRCAPVGNAIVELWQNSPTGRWLLAGQDDLVSAGPVFAGAGRTYTDNEGNFSFITAFPAPLGGHAPFVNVKVLGRGIPTVTTALYFSGDARNDADTAYGKIATGARKDTLIQMSQGSGDEIIGTVQLVIASKAPYRTY